LTLKLFNITVYSAEFNNIELVDHRFGTGNKFRGDLCGLL